ncbi:MAG: hypothetical protein AAFO07_18660 [Bacteroidota bacterium]
MKAFSKVFTLIGLILLLSVASVSSSCSKKVGCPAQESLKAQTNKRGELKNKKGKSNLFDKKMRRKN